MFKTKQHPPRKAKNQQMLVMTKSQSSTAINVMERIQLKSADLAPCWLACSPSLLLSEDAIVLQQHQFLCFLLALSGQLGSCCS